MKPAVIIFSTVIVLTIITIIIITYLIFSTTDESDPYQSTPASASEKTAVTPSASAPKAAPKTNCTGSNANSYNLKGNRLKKGETLTNCDGLVSDNKKNISVMQSDGNWVLYDTYNAKPIWATNTVNGIDRNGALPFRMVYQGDSNLVLYDSGNKVMWASNTENRPSDNLIMQEDSNLVLHTGEPSHIGSVWAGPAIWATNTNR
jgi:hypothetical protein